MNISVKKFSKKSFSLLIALIMVFSALPLTPPISADAATSTIQMTAMGCFRNGTANRVGTDYVSVCNDSQNTNFDIAVFNFDISSLSFKTYDEVSAMFNYYTRLTESENKGVSFYYPTAHLSEFEIVNNYQGQPNTSIWTGDDGKHLSRAISYYGLQPLQLGITTSSTKKTDNLDIGAAIKFAKLQGNSIATAVAVIASAGKSGSSGGWTDTRVGYSSKSVTVNITEVSAKEYVKQNIDNVKTSYPNISENNAGSFASNLVVADSWGSIAENNFAVDNDKNNDDTIRVHGYSNAVAIYTGSNSVKFPVVLEKVANSDQNNKFDLYQQIEHVALENGASFSLGSTWEYCNSPTDFTSKTLTTTTGDYVRNISSNINTTLTTDQGVNDKKDINTAKNDKFATELGKSFKNYIAYNGTGNTSSYYDKLSAPVFDYQADYAVYYAEVGFWGDYTWYITYKNSLNQNLSSNGNYYVINMKPLLDITTNSSFKENFLNVYNNESKYETASLNAYYQTMADIVAFDLTSRGLDTEQKIASVASEIKSMVSNYALPTSKTITVQFVNYAGYTVKRAILNPGEAIGEFPANTASTPDSSMPDLGHNVYYWNTDLTKDFIPTTDVTINELQGTQLIRHSSTTPATCTTKQTCDACGEEFGSYGEHTYDNNLKGRQEPGPVINGFTYTKCDNCDNKKPGSIKYDDVSSYWANYKNQLEVCETELSNTAKYTADSIASVRSTVDSIKEDVESNGGFGDEALSADFIDGKTRSLMTELTNLKIAKYKVTLRFKDENGVSLTIPGSTANYQDSEEISYGNITLAEIPKAFEDNGYSVIKWARIGENADTIHGLNSSSLNVVVKKNMEYAVYLKKTTVDDNQVANNAVITLNNKSNKVADIGYVPMNQDGTETKAKVTVDTDAGTIKIGDTTLTAPKYSFYNLIGFEIGGIRVASGQTITLNSKMVIRPVYEAKQTVRITRASANILINGKNDDSVDVEWNKKIVMTYNGAVPNGQVVIWKDGNGNVLAQGTTYTFYSNSNVTISASVEASAPAEPTASIGLFSYDPTDNKVTVVNNFYVPDGMTATKAGVILSTKNSTREALIAQTNGKFEGDESQFTTDKNQIRISVSRTAKTSFTMYALAYVEVGGQTYYAPTVQSITYTVKNS